MINIYDTANQLASNIQETAEFKSLQEAIAGVRDNKDSSALFQKMNDIQAKIIDTQSQGKDLPQDVQEDYQKLNDQVQKDALIMKLLQAEQGLYKTIDDVQKAITKPINDLYEGLRN